MTAMKAWLDLKKTTNLLCICLAVWGCGSEGGGNSSPADTIPPTTSITCSPSPNAAGWSNRTVTCTLTATDNPGGSGVKEIVYNINSNVIVPGERATVTLSSEGVIDLQYFAVDRLDNHETFRIITIKIDKTLPSIRATVFPLPNRNGWNNTNVEVRFNCSDTVSGISPFSCPLPVPITTEGVDQVVIGTVTDQAGNIAAASATVNIDKTPPFVVSTDPPDGASPVDVYGNISITFSEAVDPPTITKDTIKFSPANVINITDVTVNETSVTFKPVPRLAFTTQYTVTPNTGVKDLAGNSLEQVNHSWSFTTRDRAWGADAIPIETNSGTALKPQVAVDGGGNAIAVWEQNGDIWANRYSTSTNSWGNATVIEGNSGTASNPQVAVDQGGNATVVWEQNGGIWTNRYVVSTNSWGSNAIQIDPKLGTALGPQVAMDRNGNAVVVWIQPGNTNPPYSSRDTRNSIWASRYTTAGWSLAIDIKPLIGDAASPQVAMDGTGSAIAVWVLNGHVWANRCSCTITGWSRFNSIQIEAYNATPSTPQVAMDGKGNATAVWAQNGQLWANRYVSSNLKWIDTDPSTPQIDATLIVANAGAAPNHQVAMDAIGNAIAVWVQDNHISAIRYDVANTSWGMTTPIEANFGTASTPQVAMDGNGNAVAVWAQFDGIAISIWANRYLATIGQWGSLQDGTLLIIESGTGPAMNPQISMDPSGGAIAVWEQDSHIWTNGFN